MLLLRLTVAVFVLVACALPLYADEPELDLSIEFQAMDGLTLATHTWTDVTQKPVIPTCLNNHGYRSLDNGINSDGMRG